MDESIRLRMKSLGDDELRTVLTVDAHHWREEALAIARAELRARGLAEATPAEVAALARRREEDLPTRWLTFTVWALPLGAAMRLLKLVLLGAFGSALLWLVFEAVPSSLLSYGLHKRRYWAWQLNWVMMLAAVAQVGWSVAVLPSHPLLPLVIIGVYLAANGRYYLRRRHLFT